MSITLTSSNKHDLDKFADKMSRYLERSSAQMTSDGFEYWHQDLINGFYGYCYTTGVLPLVDDQGRLSLTGPINSVCQAHQKHQLINALRELKISMQPCSTANVSTNGSQKPLRIILSHSLADLTVCRRLATRLTEEGFSVGMRSHCSDSRLPEIDQSELIIVCISESYLEDELCYREATYAYESGRNIIPIRVQYCQSMQWFQSIVEKYACVCLPLFGSDEHFNLGYDKVLLKIVSRGIHQ